MNRFVYQLPEDMLHLLESKMSEQIKPVGSYLFREHQPVDRLYYIRQGIVSLSKSTEDGRDFVLGHYGKGDIIGEFAGLSPIAHHCNALIKEEATLGVLLYTDLEPLLVANGALAVEMLKWMGTMHRLTQSKLRDLMFYGKIGALCSTIIRMVNTYGEPDGENRYRITRKMTNQEIAEYIGATRESVNRMLSDLKANKVISLDQGHLIVHSLDYLREICHCEGCAADICRM